jgi:hypothetical protein
MLKVKKNAEFLDIRALEMLRSNISRTGGENQLTTVRAGR